MNHVTSAVVETSLAEAARVATTRWLGRFEEALRACDTAALAALFARSATTEIYSLFHGLSAGAGSEAIAAFLADAQASILARDFDLAEGARRHGWRAGWGRSDRGYLRFETAIGRGLGVVRLLATTRTRLGC